LRSASKSADFPEPFGPTSKATLPSADYPFIDIKGQDNRTSKFPLDNAVWVLVIPDAITGHSNHARNIEVHF
jgi:hypothetical protein